MTAPRPTPKFVGVDTGHRRLPPAEILEKWVVALRAAQRYMRQFDANAEQKKKAQKSAKSASNP